jgi:hypothetical protein
MAGGERQDMRHVISYGNWTIAPLPVAHKGFDFLIGADMSKPSDKEPYIMILFVGCFQDPAKGVRICKRLIDLCIEKNRRSTAEIINVCVENFQDYPPTTVKSRDRNDIDRD